MNIDELIEELQKIKERAGGWNMPVLVKEPMGLNPQGKKPILRVKDGTIYIET